MKTLTVTYTNYGAFNRAEIDDKRITREEFTEITGLDTYQKFTKTWEFKVRKWAESQSEYQIKFFEKKIKDFSINLKINI